MAGVARICERLDPGSVAQLEVLHISADLDDDPSAFVAR